jgi:hypothetical protein
VLEFDLLDFGAHKRRGSGGKDDKKINFQRGKTETIRKDDSLGYFPFKFN